MRLFLCGDLMLARGIDQILPHPGDPTLHEPYVHDARQYVQLAEEVSGTIPKPVDFSYIWGGLPEMLEVRRPDVRIGNLETSVTTRDEYAREKGIHYRMSPRNVEVLETLPFDCVTLGNNHVLDWGVGGLRETLDTLGGRGIGYCGAGADSTHAAAPWQRVLAEGEKLSVFGIGDRSSGVPKDWTAREDRPGVFLKPGNRNLEAHLAQAGRGVRIASIHWGENWGYAIPRRQQNVARSLIDRAGVTIVHGHSSHHPKGFELYQGGIIIYGAGDFINDYEGIGGHERYRPDLTAGYVVEISPDTHHVVGAELLVFRIQRMRLHRASAGETGWMAETLERVSPQSDCRLRPDEAGSISIEPGTTREGKTSVR
jgi:poly-gamma-glutamate synthesis protein (capsule biosynthesis protein)